MRHRGVIFKIFFAKGFAFARSDVDSLSYFVHINNMRNRQEFDTLREGKVIEFTPEKTNKGNGLVATEIQCI